MQVCEEALSKLTAAAAAGKKADDPNEISTLTFWKAVALSSQGMDSESISVLESLRKEIETHNSTATASGAAPRDALTLPIVVALIGGYGRKPLKAGGGVSLADAQKQKKTVLLGLKKELKACSKTSTDIGMTVAGRYFLHTGKTAKARQCVERVFSKCRSSVFLLSTLGWIYLLSGITKYEAKASSVFKKALKLCPAPASKYADVSALMGRALCAERERKFEEALNAIKQVATIHPYVISSSRVVSPPLSDSLCAPCVALCCVVLCCAGRLESRTPNAFDYRFVVVNGTMHYMLHSGCQSAIRIRWRDIKCC